MFLIDLEQGRIIDDKELKDNLANAKPYKQWIDAVRIKLDEIEAKAEDVATERREAAALLDRQQAFGYTQEDLKFLMAPMAQPGEEAHRLDGQRLAARRACRTRTRRSTTTSSSCSRKSRTRRSTRSARAIVMSLVSFIGPKPNLLDINNVNPPMRLEVSQPVLDFDDMAKIRAIDQVHAAASSARTS